MLKITDPNNFGRTLVGVSLLVAPVLLGAGEVLRLSIEGGTVTGSAEHLTNVGADLGLWNAMAIVNMVSTILFVPVVLGLIHLVRRSAPVLAHVGGALALIGVLGAAGHNVFAHVLDAAMAGLVDGRAQMLALAERLEQTPSFVFVLLMFIVGFVLGLVLLAIGVLRAGVVPRWTGVVVALAMLLFANAGASMPLTLVAVALLVAGLGTIGYRVLAMTDAQWQHRYPPTARQDLVRVGASGVQ